LEILILVFLIEPAGQGCVGVTYNIPKSHLTSGLNFYPFSSFGYPRSFFFSFLGPLRRILAMQITPFFVALALAASSVSGLPTTAVKGRGIFDTIGAADDLLIFDSPGFPDPANSGDTLISLQTFVSLRQIDLGLVTKAVTDAISALGVEVGDSLNILQGRNQVNWCHRSSWKIYRGHRTWMLGGRTIGTDLRFRLGNVAEDRVPGAMY
jgi:hypothetical protein